MVNNWGWGRYHKEKKSKNAHKANPAGKEYQGKGDWGRTFMD